MATILIVDDEKPIRDLLARALGADYDVVTAADAELAMKALDADPSIALMLSDVRMPGADGITLLKAARAKRPDLAVIMLTAYGNVELAVEAMKSGANDFLTKPVELDQLDLRIAKALGDAAPQPAAPENGGPAPDDPGLGDIVGASPAMNKVFRMVRQAAPTDATILLEGPSGTGKELFARAIHRLSRRASGPFVAVECAALNPNLLESELFGHVKGAYTGADADRVGRFEAANGGTLFLDEISEIPPSTQVKLLRALESRSFERLGSSETVSTDIRIVAACNRDLKKLAQEGKFREDLYYRLNVIDLHLPPLCERRSDIALLAGKFVKEFSAMNGGRVTGISPEALKVLEAYRWPGNVRELRNVVEKMVVLSSGGDLRPEDVPDDVRAPAAPAEAGGGDSLEAAEKAKILAVLDECGGNITRAAEKLGISRRTLHRRLNEWNA